MTALTVVTLVVALTGYFVGAQSDQSGHTELRLAIVIFAFALATLIYRKAIDSR